MTVTSDTYIQNITDQDEVASPSFTIAFPVYDVDDIYVWTKAVATGVLTRQTRGVNYNVSINGSTGTLAWVGNTPDNAVATIRVQRHMRRVLKDEYKSAMLQMSNADIEGSLDKITMLAQQSLGVDSTDVRNLTAVGDRVSDIADSSAETSAISKSQVDTGIGVGTSPWTVSSGDVGKHRKFTVSGAAAGGWGTFTGLADPRGYMFKYYTAAGWVDISGNLPDIAGSADNYKLLMDIDGTATWTAVNEVGTTFDDSPANKPGKVYSIVTHSGERKSTVREYDALDEVLPNKEGQRLTPLETALSTGATGYGLSNDLELGRTFKITTHTVTCTKKTSTTHHNGLSTDDAASDHPVYLGTIDNMTGDDDTTVFLSPHMHAIPDDKTENGHTATRWWQGPHRDVPDVAEPLKVWSWSYAQDMFDFTFIMNVVSVTDSTVTFTAASMLHETSYIHSGMSDWGNMDNPPDTDIRVQRFMKHPDSISITFNVLWYLQRA